MSFLACFQIAIFPRAGSTENHNISMHHVYNLNLSSLKIMIDPSLKIMIDPEPSGVGVCGKRSARFEYFLD